MMSLVTRMRRRSLSEIAAFTRATILVVLVRFALRVLPYRAVERRLRPGDVPDSGGGSPEVRERTLWAVGAAARQLLGSRPCLTQALVARWLLGRYGYATELRIGVAKGPDGTFLAHAWLERDGGVVIGGLSSPHRYRALHPMRQGA